MSDRGIKNSFSANIINGLVEFSYLATIFAVPLYFAFIIEGSNIFELHKLVLFKILVSLFAVSFVVKILVGTRDKNNGRSGHLGRYLLLPFLYLAAVAVSAFWSRFPELSFWGDHSRHQGLFSHLYYFTFFLLLVFHIKDFKQVKRALAAAGISSLLVSVYGICQILGWDFFTWTEPPHVTGRTFSSMGQPNFLGAYLLLAIPASLYLFYISRSKRWRFVWALTAALNFICLYFTLSRASWIGVAVGIFLTSALYIFYFQKKRDAGTSSKNISVLMLLIFFVGLGGIFHGSKVVERMASGFDTDRGSVALRLEYWDAARQGIREALLTGHGPDTQRQVLFSYYEKGWGVFADANVIPSRAHNIILDKLLTVGVLGSLLYMALLVQLFYLILKGMGDRGGGESEEEKFFFLTAFFALVSYLTSMLFQFEVVVTHVYFWLYLALVTAVYVNDRTKEFLEESGMTDFRPASLFFRRRTLLGLKILLILILCSSFFIHTRRQLDHLIADHYYRYIEVARAQKDYFRAFELYDYIEQLDIPYSYYNRKAALTASDLIEDLDGELYKELGRKVAREALNDIAGSEKFEDIYAEARAHTALAIVEDRKEYFSAAEEGFRDLVEKSPQRPKNYRSYARMLFEKGEYGKALENYDQALGFLPSPDRRRMNEKHIKAVENEVYEILKGKAEVYFESEEYKRAEKYYREALEKRPSAVELYKKVADTYYKRDMLEEAIHYNERGYISDPRDPSWPFSIALLYRKMGERDKALDYGRRALELSPKRKDIQNFVDELKD